MATAKVETPVQPVVPHFNRSEPGSVNIALASFPNSTKQEPKDIDGVAQALIDKFNKALDSGDTQSILDLFLEDCYWRDHLGLAWDFHTLKGREKVNEFLGSETRGLKKLTILRDTPFKAPHYGALDGKGDLKGVEFLISFEAERGTGRGLCRIVEENSSDWKIFSLFTTLEELNGHPEATGHNRPEGVQHGENKNRENWLDRRNKDFNYENGKEPAVVIVGAGQAGLTVAARLKVLGVDALIVDKLPRVGDNWRNRYKSLVLHDPVKYDQMPLLEFPSFWPTYTPKDKLGDWFELYSKALELNVWSSSTVTSSSWDKEKKQWTIQIDRTTPDGKKEDRTFHPRHIIQATGHSGKMSMPDIKGMKDFKGRRLCHSSEFPGVDKDAQGKRAIVVGSCNSGHDLAQTFVRMPDYVYVQQC